MASGVIVVDRWQLPDRVGKRGRKALRPDAERCPSEARYLARAFVEGRYVNRTFPDAGQAEQWGEGVRKGTAYVPQLSEASVSVVGKAYLDALQNRPGGSATGNHLMQVQRCIDGLLGAGADHMDDPAFGDRVRNWLTHLRVKKAWGKTVTNASDSYRHKMLVLTRAMVRFAMDRDLIGRDPTRIVKMARGQTKQRRVFSIDELRNLVCDDARWMDRGKRDVYQAAVRRHGTQAAAARSLGVPLTTLHCRLAAEPRPDPWWRFAVVTAYTGLRASEIAAMRWQWLDLDRGILRVPANAPGNKTKRERPCRIQQELLDLLRGPFKEGASPSMPVIGEVAQMASDEQARCQGFRDYIVRSGVEPAGRNAHCLRHSVCSLMTALNASHFLVMEAVGHVSVAVTRQYSLGAKEYLDQLGDWPRNDEWPEFWLRRRVKARQAQRRG